MTIRDGGWELFKWDAKTGVSTWHYFDGANHHFRTDYPADNLVDENKALGAERAGRRHMDGVGELVARVPLPVYFDKLAEAERQRDDAFLSRWLNDGDNAAFRVREGRT